MRRLLRATEGSRETGRATGHRMGTLTSTFPDRSPPLYSLCPGVCLGELLLLILTYFVSVGEGCHC